MMGIAKGAVIIRVIEPGAGSIRWRGDIDVLQAGLKDRGQPIGYPVFDKNVGIELVVTRGRRQLAAIIESTRRCAAGE